MGLNGIEPAVMPENFQAFWMHWVMLGIIVVMVLAGSLLFAAPSFNATFSFVILIFELKFLFKYSS